MKRNPSPLAAWVGASAALLMSSCGRGLTPEGDSTTDTTRERTETARPSLTANATVQATAEAVLASPVGGYVTESPTPTMPVITCAEGELDGSGPWMVGLSPGASEDSYLVVFVSLDPLTCSTHMMPLPSHRYFSEDIAKASPQGGVVALISAGDTPEDYRLLVLSLPALAEVASIRLVSPQARTAIDSFEYDIQTPLQGVHPLLAILHAANIMEWSPDGRYLAFVGAPQGSSSDVYVFDTASNLTQRLTWGETQALLMGWSPDSEWVVHMAATAFAYEGPIPEGVWAASPAGPAPRLLYDLDPWVIHEAIVGWQADDEFLSTGWAFEASSPAVYSVSIPLGGRYPRAELPSMGAAYDPESDNLLVNASGYLGPGPDLVHGLYLHASQDEELRLVRAGEFYRLEWNAELGMFSAVESMSETTMLFGADGTFGMQLDDASRIYPSPDGQYILTAGHLSDRLLTARGELVRRTEDFHAAVWLPDSSGFLISECPGGIYAYEEGAQWQPRSISLEGGACPSILLMAQ